jgi:hypothetical protein
LQIWKGDYIMSISMGKFKMWRFFLGEFCTCHLTSLRSINLRSNKPIAKYMCELLNKKNIYTIRYYCSIMSLHIVIDNVMLKVLII